MTEKNNYGEENVDYNLKKLVITDCNEGFL